MNIDNSIDDVIDSLRITGLGSGVLHSDSTGLVTSSGVVNADISAGAGIVDTKLATISTAGKVSNSSTTATSANTANAIVARGADKSVSIGATTVISDNATTMTGQQLTLMGASNSNQLLGVGYNTTGDFGYVQSLHNLVSYTPLCLQPIAGVTLVNATTAAHATVPFQVIGNNPSSGNWGGRLIAGGNGSSGSDDSFFIAGLYNAAGTKRVTAGAHTRLVNGWADLHMQEGANLLLHSTSGTTTIGSSTAGTEKLKVVGNFRVTTTSALDGDITSSGNLKIGAGTQTGAGTLNYTSNRFTINNNGTVFALSNPVNLAGTSQATMCTQEIVITRVAGSFAVSTSSTTQGFSAASVSSNTPLEVTVNFSFGTAPLWGNIHVIYSSDTTKKYDGGFKNSIPGSNTTNVIKLYFAGSEVSTAAFADGNSFRLTVYLAGY